MAYSIPTQPTEAKLAAYYKVLEYFEAEELDEFLKKNYPGRKVEQWEFDHLLRQIQKARAISTEMWDTCAEVISAWFECGARSEYMAKKEVCND